MGKVLIPKVDGPTLPDLLRPGLQLVFIGINPGLYSVAKGHYFARTTSRFWPALSRSRLGENARRGLGVDVLGPVHDRELLRFGIGFTDVVKRPTANASQLLSEEFVQWAPVLVEKLKRYRASVACFHGLTAYRPFAKLGLGLTEKPELGAQSVRMGSTRVFVVPNPSPANAHFNVAEQTAWYDRLADFIGEAV